MKIYALYVPIKFQIIKKFSNIHKSLHIYSIFCNELFFSKFMSFWLNWICFIYTNLGPDLTWEKDCSNIKFLRKLHNFIFWIIFIQNRGIGPFLRALFRFGEEFQNTSYSWIINIFNWSCWIRGNGKFSNWFLKVKKMFYFAFRKPWSDFNNVSYSFYVSFPIK